MKKFLLLTVIFISIFTLSLNSQVTPKEKGLQAITVDAIKGQLEFLSSDWMEGRATGERGAYLAADYIASMFKVFGVSPAGDAAMGGRGRFRMPMNPPAAAPTAPAAAVANPPAPNQPAAAPAPAAPTAAGPAGPFGQGGQPFTPSKTYFQDFTLIETQPTEGSILIIKKGSQEYTFKEGIDFSISRATMDVKFDAPVVFAGYGIVDKANGIDDFAGVDVKGKVIIRLSGFPGYTDNTSPMYKKLIGDNMRAQFEMQRKKSDAITNLGVLGVIDLTINNDITKRWGVYKFNNIMAPAESIQRTNWSSMRLDGKEVTSNPTTLTITERVSNLLIKEGGLDIAKYEKDAAAGIVKFKPVQLTGITAALNVSVNGKRVNVRNVVAIIEGENPNEYVAVGAHMDHMGMDNGKIWNGADDNASGTVAVMTLSKAFAASGVKPKRSIVFCTWTGEEKGLLGSEYYTNYPSVGKMSDYKFYMNFDMIARDATNDTAKNKAGITYTKAYPKLEEITKAAVAEYKFNLNLNIRSQDAPTGGSDYTAFTENKIPVIAWMAAMHSDYHQPSDEVSLVNWNKMLDIIKLGYLQLWEAANGEIK
ncbi:MAG: M20/M25/M40 family metallo-hydrolase [Bacteroidia bacterium]|nr:M20/M25/M40 family metallo-hydrolase [Bacteroidia bacterium]